MKYIALILMISLYSCDSVQSGFAKSKNIDSKRWIAWASKPSKTWEDAFVTGNGTHGTMVMGHPGDERITCVHEELFIRGWNHNMETVPETASLLPEMRRLIDERRNDEASRLITNESDRQLNAMGAKQRWPLIPHPAFDLRIQYTNQSTNSNDAYRRQLNLETGVTSVLYDGDNGISESVFSSREHNINVVRLKAGKHNKINTTLSLEETPGRSGVHYGHNLDSAFTILKSEAYPGWLTYSAAYSYNPVGYEGIARVILKGGEMHEEGSTLEIIDADEVLVLIRINPLSEGNVSQEIETKKELESLSTNYDELLRPHSTEHGEMFRRMQFDLGCASQWEDTPTEQMLATVNEQGVTPLFMEQMHAMGRYLLISSSGKYPPPLQGIWGGGWKPEWIGGFVWDSNLNLAISSAAMSNLPECSESYCGYVESLLPGWRLNAKNYLGTRGFIVAHYNDPENGYLTHFNDVYPWMCWSGGAGWNLRPIYEYAMMIGDNEMLEKRVLPLYREAVDLYEDFLIMGSDSLLHFNTSISPENFPIGSNTLLSKDATMDVAIARDVFSILLEMGEQFDIAKDEKDKWNYYLNLLPEYRINEDGALAEWIDPDYTDVYNHRHLSHLYPVFPGTQIGKHNGDDKLLNAVQVALDKRFEFDTSSAHGLIHLALQAVRIGDMDKLTKNLDRFSRRNYVYDGLVTSHDPNHHVYNLDAILSLPRLFMEMLVYTEPGKIELLPAWPKEYSDGQIKGIRVFGGHTLDISWKDGELLVAELNAIQDGVIEVSYGDKARIVELKKGITYQLDDILK